MLHKRRLKRILAIVFVFMVATTLISKVSADINWDYYNKAVSSMLVADANLDEKVSGSALLSAIGLLIYSVGSLMEWVLGSVYKLITGTNIFPWADAILFNGLPLLDVNFISPASANTEHGSVDTLVGYLQGFLGNIYSTLFGLAITFFSIAVMIMAIKLVISTIASEKAKYKSALVQWGTGLILLFTIHYAISFVFYLNESLVKMASDMVVPSLERAEDKINQINQVNEDDAKVMVENFIDSMEACKITDILSLGINRLTTTYDAEVNPEFNDVEKAKEYIRAHPLVTINLLQNKGYTDWRFGEKDWYNFRVSSTDAFWTWSAGDKSFIKVVADNVYDIVENNIPGYEEEKNELQAKIQAGTASNDEIAKYKFYVAMIEANNEYRKLADNANYSVISNLAQFFKTASWQVGNGSWRANSVVIQYSLLYAILVVQSLILFIAYVKRLFYVILLAMMAPIVVVFDFFNKTV